MFFLGRQTEKENYRGEGGGEEKKFNFTPSGHIN